MDTRKFGSWVFFCLTILAAELIAEMAMHLVADFTQSHNPYKATAIQMVVAIIVFFPVFQLIDTLVKKSSYESNSKKSFYYLLSFFVVGLFAIYGLYLKVKFNINIFEKIF